MRISQIISVNPALKTKGELGLGVKAGLANISRSLTAPGSQTASCFKRIFNLFFGLNKKVNPQLSGKLLLLRVLCGGLIIAMALVPLTPEAIMALDIPTEAIIACCVGFALIIGLFTRLAGYTGTGWYGFLLYESILAGTPDMTCACLLVFSLLFCVLGPGLFSSDQLIRRSIFRIRHNIITRNRRKISEAELDYRAYSRVEKVARI